MDETHLSLHTRFYFWRHNRSRASREMVFKCVIWFFVSVGRCENCRAEIPFWRSAWNLVGQSPRSVWRLLFCEDCVSSKKYASCSRMYRMRLKSSFPPVPFLEKWWNLFLIWSVKRLAPSRKSAGSDHRQALEWVSRIRRKADRSARLTAEESAVLRSWVWCWIGAHIPPREPGVCLWVEPAPSSRSRAELCRAAEDLPTRRS